MTKPFELTIRKVYRLKSTDNHNLTNSEAEAELLHVKKVTAAQCTISGEQAASGCKK
jgi:hypothetical protein